MTLISTSPVVAAYIEAIYFTEQEGEDLTTDGRPERPPDRGRVLCLPAPRPVACHRLAAKADRSRLLAHPQRARLRVLGSGLWDTRIRDALTLLAQRFDIQDWYVGDNAIPPR